jgi:hypothetical protein
MVPRPVSRGRSGAGGNKPRAEEKVWFALIRKL